MPLVTSLSVINVAKKNPTNHNLPLTHSDSNLEKSILYLRESKVMRGATERNEWRRVAGKAEELRPCECFKSDKWGFCNEMVQRRGLSCLLKYGWRTLPQVQSWSLNILRHTQSSCSSFDSKMWCHFNLVWKEASPPGGQSQSGKGQNF